MRLVYPPPVPRSLSAAAVALAVLASGGAALVYQVAFERYLARLVGSDHVAAGLTLAAFLGGLALGYGLCGRMTLTVRDHALGYAALEALIGILGLVFPTTFAIAERVVSDWSFAQPWGLAAQGTLVAAALIVPPTVLMGATVPFVTRAAAAARDEVSSVHAAVYAINTAGAFVGVLAAGFWIVPRFGLPGALRCAAAANLAVAAAFAALFFARRARGTPLAVAGSVRRPRAPRARFQPSTILAMALLNGLAVLLLETAAIRIGKLTLGSSSYTFAMIVAVAVLGLAAGGAAIARARRIGGGALPAVQTAAGIWLLFLFASLDLWPYLAHLVRIGFQPGAAGFAMYHAALFVVLFVALGPPFALLGTVLPILYHELDATVPESGALSGRLLAWNGVGTVLGALLGSFVLFVWLDIGRVFLLVPVVVLANALIAAWSSGRVRRAIVAVVGVLSLATLIAQPLYDENRLVWGLFREREPLPFSFKGPGTFYREYLGGRRVLARDDDPVASIAVVEVRTESSASGRSLALVSNGRSESDTAVDAETIRLAAHLPALWAARRDRVLVIGSGTGVTAGEVSLYPDVTRIDLAEISPAVVRFLPLFGEFTRGVHRDARLRVVLGDALLTLRRSREPWDIIVSEPSNPWVSGADQLFTREFYELVRERLAEGGLFLQWIQLYESSYAMLCVMLNTLRAEFPVVHAFRGSENDLLLLASTRPFTTEDRQRAEVVLAAHPDVAESLAGLGIASISDVLAREVGTLPIVMRQARRYGVNTADHPRLHYMAGRALFDGATVSKEHLRHGETRLDFLFDHAIRD